MIKKLITLKSLSILIILMLLIAICYNFFVLNTLAAEGTDLNVGMLLDEGLLYYDADYWNNGEQNKISGWELDTSGGNVRTSDTFDNLRILMSNNSAATKAKIYFTTTEDSTWNETKSKEFTIFAYASNNEYIIDMSSVPGWGTRLKQIRFDPMNDSTSSGTFDVDYIVACNDNLDTYALYQHFLGSSGWTGGNISGLYETGSKIGGTITSSDPQIVSPDNLNIQLNYGFRITDNSTTKNVTMKKRFVKQTSGTITLTYNFMMPTQTSNFVMQLNSGTTAGVKILTSGSNLCYENSSGSAITLQAYSTFTVYKLKVVVNVTNKTYDIYVNGVSKATSVAFRNNISDLNYLQVNTGTSEQFDVYVSPIKIYNVTYKNI